MRCAHAVRRRVPRAIGPRLPQAPTYARSCTELPARCRLQPHPQWICTDSHHTAVRPNVPTSKLCARPGLLGPAGATCAPASSAIVEAIGCVPVVRVVLDAEVVRVRDFVVSNWPRRQVRALGRLPLPPRLGSRVRPPPSEWVVLRRPLPHPIASLPGSPRRLLLRKPAHHR